MQKTLDTGANLYYMNKQIMNQYKPLTHLELPQKQKALENWFNMKCDSYAMLLCHERRDYTVFHMYCNPPANANPPAVAAKECIECLLNRGQILAIDPTKDKQAFEIWLRIGKDNVCYYLFPYDSGVIEV